MKLRIIFIILLFSILIMCFIGCPTSPYESLFHPDYRIGVYIRDDWGDRERYFFHEKCYVSQISGGCAIASAAMWLKYIEYLGHNDGIGELWDTTVDTKQPYNIVFSWFQTAMEASWDIDNFVGITSSEFTKGMNHCINFEINPNSQPTVGDSVPLGAWDEEWNFEYFTDDFVDYTLKEVWTPRIVNYDRPLSLGFIRWGDVDAGGHRVIAYGIQTEEGDKDYEKVYGIYISNPADTDEKQRLLDVEDLELFRKTCSYL